VQFVVVSKELLKMYVLKGRDFTYSSRCFGGSAMPWHHGMTAALVQFLLVDSKESNKLRNQHNQSFHANQL
jgi:hypothetical protein